MIILITSFVFLVVCILLVQSHCKRIGLSNWIVPYTVQTIKRNRSGPSPVRMFICIADHFEPNWGHASESLAKQRVENWVTHYPKSFSNFRDSDGRPPRHTFFYPIEEYNRNHLDALASLCHKGYGELEIHLHHDHDTHECLTETLIKYKEIFVSRHRSLSRRRDSDEICYGFIHGNWALNNSRPDGRYCGVDNELSVLQQTGCYADFTFPSAPSPTQPRTINSIYYASDRNGLPRPHDCGTPVGTTTQPDYSLMLIQGPLVLDWKRRKWGLAPRIENGCLQANQPPSLRRLHLWIKARVQVPTRPDWYFIKLHTHGATERNSAMLLGEPMVHFHKELAQYAKTNTNVSYHYVTAREMYNLIRAAESGYASNAVDALNYELLATADCR